MRFLVQLVLLFIGWSASLAGEIIVYSQAYSGSRTNGTYQTMRGKGYILLDLQNNLITRISTGAIPFAPAKVYFVDTYSAAVLSEPSPGIGVTLLAAQATELTTSAGKTESTIFFKGREFLQSIGPSQQTNVPKGIAGLFRRTNTTFGSSIAEESFTAVFNPSLTKDTNANSRTIDAEAALLVGNLKAAGLIEWSR